MENTPYYDPRVVIFKRKMFIRLATEVNHLVLTLVLERFVLLPHGGAFVTNRPENVLEASGPNVLQDSDHILNDIYRS